MTRRLHTLPNEVFSSRVRPSGTMEGNCAEQTQAVRVCVTAIGPRRKKRPRKDARPRQDARSCTDRH
jgi:hypothetical protein